MSLPAGRRRLARTFRSASSRLPKPAPRTPDPQPMRGYRYVWRLHLFCLRSRLDTCWQEAWPRHDNKSCERCSSTASNSHLFSRSDDTAVACFFSPLSGSDYSGRGGPCCHVCGTQRASPVNAHISTCQSDVELTCRLPTCRVQVSTVNSIHVLRLLNARFLRCLLAGV